MIEQLRNHIGASPLGANMQRRNVVLRRREIHIRSACRQQHLGNLDVAVVRRNVQRRKAALGHDIGAVLALQKESSGRDVVLFRRNVQRGKTHFRARVVLE